MKPTSSTPKSTAADEAHRSLLELSGTDAFAPMRWLDRYSDKISLNVRSDQVQEAFRSGSQVMIKREGGDVVGGLLWRAVPDLADHFEIPVHEVVTTLVAPQADRKSVVTELLSALKSELAGERGGFILLRLEADDLAGLAGATRNGFELRSTSLSLINDLERKHRNPPYEAPGMNVHRFADGPLPEEMYSVLRSAPTPLVDDHYHADPRLDNQRCDALYDRKRERVIEGIGADVMVYREVDGTVTGFGTFKRAADVGPYGITLLDGSFGYRPPGAPAGHGGAAAEFMCNEELLDNRFVEWDTQVTNYGMVNMLIGRPSIRLVRSSYILHCWTDE